MGCEKYHLDETGMLMKRVKRTSGFSMVEVLVASAFIAVLAVTGLTSYNYMRNLRNRSTDVCRVHVSGVIERFRSIGYFSAINNFNPVALDRTFEGNSPTSLQSKGIPNTQLWPSVSILEAAPRPTLNNSVLISSSINALLAIYNTNPAYCANPNGAPYEGSNPGDPNLITRPSADLKDSSINLRIIPYSIETGNPLPVACPMPLRIAPEASSTSNTFTVSPAKADRGDTRYDTGLLVKVIENYTNEDGLPSSCSIEQRFQYSPDIVAPAAPNLATMSPVGTSVGDCGTPNRDVTITIGYQDPVVLEPGAVLVCRDNSIPGNTPATGYAMYTCQNGTVPQVVGIVSPAPAKLPPGITGLHYQTGYDARNQSGSNEWKPCDQVTACDVPPESASLLGGSSTNQPRYQLTYRNLPPGCRVNIEVAAIDTASNSSTNFLTAHSASNDSLPNVSINTIEFDVARPNCGSMCGPCGAGSCGAMPPDVYFRCGGCL